MDNNQVRFGFVGDARRLAEIVSVANKHKLTRGITPENLCATFQDLGPAFIKIGQMLSLHPEVLPQEYCDALRALRIDVPSINAAQIRDLITEEYGKPWNTVFSSIRGIPEGSASIAQVHEAYLLDGTRVAIKVQRPETYQVMDQDIRLFKRALGVLKLSQIQDKMWALEYALDETWRVAKQEMNFIREAENLDRMAEIFERMEFAAVPGVYHEYTTKNVLVMEFIDGYDLNENEALEAAGYDLKEILHKLGRSYIKQWLIDGFFQADPHPGNIRIHDGQIVWLDLGMMGELPKEKSDAMRHGMQDVLKHDIDDLMKQLWLFFDMPENFPEYESLKGRVEEFVDKFATMSVKTMTHSSDLIDEIFDMFMKYDLNIPLDVIMFGRSLMVMEGNIPDLDPECSFFDIFKMHLAAFVAGDGKAGEIARKLSYRKLISGKKLHYNENRDTEEDPTDRELLTDEEYAILTGEEEAAS